MALTCGQCPDHSTIAAFVSSMRDEILPLFRDVLLVCEESHLLGGTLFALDGSKVPSNVSRHGEGMEYLPPEDRNCRASVRRYQVREGVGPVYT